MTVIEVNMEWRRGAGGGGARKPADQRHRPARFPLAKVRLPDRALSPVRLVASSAVLHSQLLYFNLKYTTATANSVSCLRNKCVVIDTRGKCPVITRQKIASLLCASPDPTAPPVSDLFPPQTPRELSSPETKGSTPCTREVVVNGCRHAEFALLFKGDYVAARPRSSSEGALRATLTRTPSVSSPLRAQGLQCFRCNALM
ncbi:hypothetical protein PR048_014422 [Dryococelus australis]|uniref:Uncharacterized protein n=1 Tax=Dryococelus australis TaxID=614101 RepID=A0ABQ9HE59_9NEOP|nr:hypothetical protein PR048_014422 [Dryococelus australis]